MKIYKLNSEYPQKIRVGKTDWNDIDDFVRSDTLFAAIVNCYVSLYGSDSVDKFIREFEEGGIKISSAFYSVDLYKNGVSDGKENEEFIRSVNFLPKPFVKFGDEESDEDTKVNERKKLKNLKFVSEEIFKDILEKYDDGKGESKTNLLDKERYSYISDEFCLLKSELANDLDVNFKGTAVQDKTQLDRIKGKASLDENEKGKYYKELDLTLSEIRTDGFTLKPRLFFLAELNSEFENQFNAALRLMCDEGLGGERNFGKGTFKGLEIDDYSYSLNADVCVNLSFVNPAKEEINSLKNAIVSYDSMLRGGWTGNSAQKKVRMIKEGSVLKNKIEGRLAEVQPESYTKHKIYKNGKGFYL